MNASKETAREASLHLKQLRTSAVLPHSAVVQLQFITAFLIAAEKKLPTEAAYARDKKRSKRNA